VEGKEGIKFEFEAGEKVFVSHGNLLYEAKVYDVWPVFWRATE